MFQNNHPVYCHVIDHICLTQLRTSDISCSGFYYLLIQKLNQIVPMPDIDSLNLDFVKTVSTLQSCCDVAHQYTSWVPSHLAYSIARSSAVRLVFA